MTLFTRLADSFQSKFFRFELARALYVRSKTIPALGLTAVVLFSFYFHTPEIGRAIQSWAVIFFAFYLFMYVYFFRAEAEPKPDNYVAWTWAYLGTCYAAAAMWGGFALIVLPTVGHADQVTLVMIMFAIIAVPVPTLSHCLPLVLGYSIIIVVCTGAGFILHHPGWDKHSVFMSILLLTCVLYFIEQAIVSMRIVKSVDDKRRLKFSGVTIERLRHDKFHDSVTDLLNRDGMARYIKRGGDELSCFILYALKVRDVDTLYSSHSKSTVDELIRYISLRIQASGFDRKVVAHLGLGEFLVLVPGESSERTVTLAGDLLGLFDAPISTFLGPMNFDVLIGCTAFPDDTGDKAHSITYALAALKEAEKHSGSRLERYNEDMALKLNRRAFIRSQIPSAISNNEFAVHVQPKVNIQTNTVESAEVLVRWFSPTMGAISPADFIPIAESTSDIIPLGRWVLEETARLLDDPGLPATFSLAVNVSVKQLADPHFVPLVQEIAGKLQSSGRTLELEITESMLVTDEIEVNQALQKLSALGVKIALDDFGTGYSSLSYLANIHANTLKLDKSFIDPIPGNDRHSSFVATVISMAHSLDMPVVAEGVETADQVQWLVRNGCDTVQGYFFSKPLPTAELFDWLDDNVCKETNDFRHMSAVDVQGSIVE